MLQHWEMLSQHQGKLVLKAQGQTGDSEWHKGSGTAESCVPTPSITGRGFHGSCEMMSLDRAFKHHPSSCHFLACGLLSLLFLPPPPPRLMHKDFFNSY